MFALCDGARGGLCGEGQNLLMRGDLKGRYGTTRVLEVHTFTDLNIYLATNPHYEKILKRLGETCPKRMGCLYKYLFSPAPILQHELDIWCACTRDLTTRTAMPHSHKCVLLLLLCCCSCRALRRISQRAYSIKACISACRYATACGR